MRNWVDVWIWQCNTSWSCWWCRSSHRFHRTINAAGWFFLIFNLFQSLKPCFSWWLFIFFTSLMSADINASICFFSYLWCNLADYYKLVSVKRPHTIKTYTCACVLSFSSGNDSVCRYNRFVIHSTFATSFIKRAFVGAFSILQKGDVPLLKTMKMTSVRLQVLWILWLPSGFLPRSRWSCL